MYLAAFVGIAVKICLADIDTGTRESDCIACRV